MLVSLDVVVRTEETVRRDMSDNVEERSKRERRVAAEQIYRAHGQNETRLDWFDGEGVYNMRRGVDPDFSHASHATLL